MPSREAPTGNGIPAKRCSHEPLPELGCVDKASHSSSAFAEALDDSWAPFLTELNLAHNSLTSDGVWRLAEACESHQAIKFINLANNSVDETQVH